MQDRVRELFEQLQHGSDLKDCVKIDAGREADVVEKDIWEWAQKHVMGNDGAKVSALGVVQA
jgi:hypothetical protein